MGRKSVTRVTLMEFISTSWDIDAWEKLLEKLLSIYSNEKLRRLPEKNIPECAGFSFVFKARQPAHSKLCNGWHNAEDARKDKPAGMFFDRNRFRRLRALGVG